MLFLRMLCIIQVVLLGHVRDTKSAPQVQQQPRESNSYASTEFTDILHFYNSPARGRYSNKWHFCPEGQKATGYALKTKTDVVPRDKYLRNEDHLTVVTGLAILCGEGGRVRATSEVGKEGTWGPDLLCCDKGKSFLTNLGVFVQRFYADGLALIDNIDFRCANPDTDSEEFLFGYGRVYDKSHSNTLTPNSWRFKCTTGICGINTGVDWPYSSPLKNPLTGVQIPKKDPSGLIDVRFVCCPKNKTRT